MVMASRSDVYETCVRAHPFYSSPPLLCSFFPTRSFLPTRGTDGRRYIGAFWAAGPTHHEPLWLMYPAMMFVTTTALAREMLRKWRLRVDYAPGNLAISVVFNTFSMMMMN